MNETRVMYRNGNADLTRVNDMRHAKTRRGPLSAARNGSYRQAMTRTRNLVVRLADDELAQMRAIADAERETAATLVRRWIRQQFEARGLSAAKASSGKG